MIRITREELYEAVWKAPATRLAKSYGISDVALTKICRKHAVPKPPAGFWAQKAFGKKVRRPPLSKRDGPSIIEIKGEVKPAVKMPPGFEQTLSALRQTKVVSPAADSEETHAEITRIRAVLGRCRPDDTGRLKGADLGSNRCVIISPQCIDRSMLLLDSLFRVLRPLGWEGTLSDGMKFACGETIVRAQLLEKVERIDTGNSVAIRLSEHGAPREAVNKGLLTGESL